MIENKIITAPEGATDLRTFMTELPLNCLFNKGITGCGGTELALGNDKNTIISMPFVPLVINKSESEKHKGNVLGIYGDISESEIEEYIRTHKI